MLYITTRNKDDAYTAYKALTSDTAPDGGRYVPFRMPIYSGEEIAALKEKTFNETIAEILNMFFSCRLAGWDLDFSVGRNIVRIAPMNHRIVVAELWHNLDGKLSYLENTLYQVLIPDESNAKIRDWVQISVRIAVLFGLYGELMRGGILEAGQTVDISVPNDSFLMPIVAWYCRKMGLPLNMIICSCEDNNSLWDMINHGVVNTSSLTADLQLGVERLIQATLGCCEAEKFHDACDRGQPYSVSEEKLSQLNKGLFCTVAGKDRAKNTINSVYRSNAYVVEPTTALCYSGLQDYRAKTGESGLTLILAERTPMDFATEICESTGINADKLYDLINHS